MPGLDPGIQFLSHALVTAYYVYMMASRKNGTLYIGVTNDLYDVIIA